ncbi:hypothetical protein Tsubulata_048365 [Turnera subulata]|uniref:DUF4283 domain-containing protein n=1 Tax=Turnera subulata TaxID=218843 RepID=A0A9Q0FZS9_9ROSI|nr:hypothetical protein Tsubulata_048365 [Turnera subulata]
MDSVIAQNLPTWRQEPERGVVVTSDEEEEILELEEVKEELIAQNKLCLLARVLGTKHYFEKRLVVLKEITGAEVFSQVEVEDVPIWIQMSNIPLHQRSQKNVMSIASKVGSFLRFDEKGEQGWGKLIKPFILKAAVKRDVSIEDQAGVARRVLQVDGGNEQLEVSQVKDKLPLDLEKLLTLNVETHDPQTNKNQVSSEAEDTCAGVLRATHNPKKQVMPSFSMGTLLSGMPKSKPKQGDSQEGNHKAGAMDGSQLRPT